MELKTSQVVAALDLLQYIAQNPLEQPSSKNISTLSMIRKSFHAKSASGKKRKQSPTRNQGPKAKRQRTTKKHSKSDKSENNSDNNPSSSDDDSASDNYRLISSNASKRNIPGDSPSHFTYFNSNSKSKPNSGIFISDSSSLTPIWSRGNPLDTNIDDYLNSVSKVFYHPIEAMEYNLNLRKKALNNNTNTNTTGKRRSSRRNVRNEADGDTDNILRYSTINLLLSPLRRRSPLDEWNPREIAIFESGMCSKGKQFYEISKLIETKNTKQVVQFYYYWKLSSHYKIWKSLGKNTNKKISNNIKKLHKKIGQTFNRFYKQQLQPIKNPNNPKQQHLQQHPQPQPQQQHISIQNDIGSGSGHYDQNNTHYIQQQQIQNAATMNMMYYPQYYHAWYPTTYSSQYPPQQYAQTSVQPHVQQVQVQPQVQPQVQQQVQPQVQVQVPVAPQPQPSLPPQQQQVQMQMQVQGQPQVPQVAVQVNDNKTVPPVQVQVPVPVKQQVIDDNTKDVTPTNTNNHNNNNGNQLPDAITNNNVETNTDFIDLTETASNESGFNRHRDDVSSIETNSKSNSIDKIKKKGESC